MFQSDDEYYADREYLTNSSLKMLHKSPSLFYMWLKRKGDNYTSNALEVGKAFHAISLEDKEIFIGYEGTRRGKEYMAFCEENSDKIILSQKDADMLYRMNDALRKCPEACELMYNGGEPEVPATGEWDGIKIKGKADLLVDVDFSPEFLVDVKTTGSELSDFSRSAPYMGYDQQAAIYCHLFGVSKFYFVVITKSFPYDIGIYECSAEFIARGAHKAQQAIDKYKKLFIENDFNPYSAAEIKIL
jgi:hypothetical protein